MVSLQIQGVAISISDEGVVAVGGEQGELGAGRGLDPADDYPETGKASCSLFREVCVVSAASAAPSIR